MEILRVAICDDNNDEQNKLLSILNKSIFPTTTTVFNCGEDFLADFQSDKYDLILMDIYMDGLTGVEVVKQIRKTDDAVTIAFITTSTDYTLEGYRLNVIKYIEKPIDEKAVNELLQLVQMKKTIYQSCT